MSFQDISSYQKYTEWNTDDSLFILKTGYSVFLSYDWLIVQLTIVLKVCFPFEDFLRIKWYFKKS